MFYFGLTPQNQGELTNIGEFANPRRIWRGEFGEFGEDGKKSPKDSKEGGFKAFRYLSFFIFKLSTWFCLSWSYKCRTTKSDFSFSFSPFLPTS